MRPYVSINRKGKTLRHLTAVFPLYFFYVLKVLQNFSLLFLHGTPLAILLFRRIIAMKTAFTVWNDRIAPLFDVAGKIHVVESEAGNITAQTRVCLDDPLPALKIRRLADLGVQMLVCGAISRSARNMVTDYGIELVAYINGDLDTVIDAWQHDQLRTDVLRMPGCNRAIWDRYRLNWMCRQQRNICERY